MNLLLLTAGCSLTTLVCSCASKDDPEAFSGYFGVDLPKAAVNFSFNQKNTKGYWFQWNLAERDFKAWGVQVVRKGYSDWVEVPDKKHYTYGDFYIEGSARDPLLISERYPQGEGGDHLIIFYRESNQRVDAIFFKNS